jgi:hypothetical protein
MAELASKANIGTKEEPYWLTKGMLVHDMRTSTLRKVTRIIFDGDHQPEFYVFLQVTAGDTDGNGRELAELRQAEIELECVGCCSVLHAKGDPNNKHYCSDTCQKADEALIEEWGGASSCDYCGRESHEPNTANCGECA